MGAHDFHTEAIAETAGEAYRNAVADALYEEGHNSYNGTISTTSGFVMEPLLEGESIYEWVHRVTMDDKITQKWENCACVADPSNPRHWHFAGWAAS